MIYSWENTTREIGEAHPEMAILPIATTEQHGAHLPVGTKSFILTAIARLVGQALPTDAYLLPTLEIGTSDLHVGTAGTLSLSWNSMAHVVRDLVESVLGQGIRNVVVFIGLGQATSGMTRPQDNFYAKVAVRELNYDHPELQAIWVQPFAVAGEALLEIFETADVELHAGEVETSVMLHLYPQLVGEYREDHVPAWDKRLLQYTTFTALCPNGIWGNPSRASAEKGARAVDATVQQTVSYIEKTFAELRQLKGAT